MQQNMKTIVLKVFEMLIHARPESLKRHVGPQSHLRLLHYNDGVMSEIKRD